MASYARTPLQLPDPRRSAAPFAVLCAAALVLEVDPRLWLLGAVAAVLFAAAGTVRALGARRELARVRRSADGLILRTPHDASALVAWRSRELTTPRSRARLRGEVERTLRMLAPDRLPSASPLRRPAARASAGELRRLAARLGDDRPVSARGVVMAAMLLRDPGSPLYNEGADGLVSRAVARVFEALEP